MNFVFGPHSYEPQYCLLCSATTYNIYSTGIEFRYVSVIAFSFMTTSVSIAVADKYGRCEKLYRG
jgi:hypothetical protein